MAVIYYSTRKDCLFIYSRIHKSAEFFEHVVFNVNQVKINMLLCHGRIFRVGEL